MHMDAKTDYPVHSLISARWSPYGYAERAVSREDLRSIFEAARWAPSCYNEQPWRYIVATRDQPEEFNRLLSCLAEANQVWAKKAPVLALGVVSTKFARNGRANRHAMHDLGLATANISLEATARGLAVHQMGGILPDRARELYGIPEDYEVVTGIAVGYPADPADVPEELRQRDLARRPRRALAQFVFSGSWASAADLSS